MLPKNSKHYIVPTAEHLDIDAQLVEDVVSFYYSALRAALVSMESINVQVENLGCFSVKKLEIPKLIKKYNRHLGVLTGDTFNQMQLRKDTQLKLERAEKLEALIRAERERKKKVIEKRNEYKKNYREQEENS